MTTNAVLEFAQRVLARRQQVGLDGSPVDCWRQLARYGDSLRAEALWELASSRGLDCEPFLIPVLAGSPAWQDQLYRFLLAPRLLDCLDGLSSLSSELAPWANPPLEIRPTTAQLRYLAMQCAARHRGLIPRKQGTVLWELFGQTQAGIVAPISIDDKTPDDDRLLSDALCFWGTPEAAPVLAARLRDDVEQANLPVLLQKLAAVSVLLKGMQGAVGCGGRDLARSVAALVVSAIRPSEPLSNSLGLALLQKPHEFYPLIGAEVDPQAVDWYEQAAEHIETDFAESKQIEQLRCDWVFDAAASWVTGNFGEVLTGKLVAAWVTQDNPTGPATDRLVSLVQQARPKRQVVEIIEPSLEALLLKRTALEAGVLSKTVTLMRMAKGSLAPRYEAVVQFLVMASGNDARKRFVEGIGKWADAFAPPRLSIARMAAALGATADASTCELVCELFLSPRQLWPSLRGRLQRTLNSAFLIDADGAFVAAAADVLRELNVAALREGGP